MTSARKFLSVFLLLLLASCASAPRNGAILVTDPQVLARIEAESAAVKRREEQALEEERAREAAAREEIARQEEQQRAAAAQAEEARQAEELRQAQLRAEAREEAERQRQLAAEQAAEQAAERAQNVARQQARIAELRAQITANNAETGNVESANATLRQAIATAEALSAALAEEQKKYDAANSAGGQVMDESSKTKIDDLTAELERLSAQAAALSQQAP